MIILQSNNPQQGFSLLEVLITLIIMAIGLLGLAGLQASGLKNNVSAYHRTQATQLAYDISDRMRANNAVLNNYLTTFMAASSASVQLSCSSTGCSNAQMAQNDLFEWNNVISNSLPAGIGSITISGGIYTININWDDNRDGVVNADDPNFQVGFQL